MKKRNQTKKQKNNGITLIALVITIIVLLILAGVSISMLTGENGILKKAGEASEKNKIATEDEQRKMAMYEATMNTELTYFQDVPIPAGFAPTRIAGESTVDEGLVIMDADGNEFVWVPVEEGSIEKEGKEEKLSDTVAWEKQEYEEMKESVEKYKGFYIGRYEAGSTTARNGNEIQGYGTTKMVVKRDQYPYEVVGWGKYKTETNDYSDDITMADKTKKEEDAQINNGKGAVYLCRHMYDGKEVGIKSTLCYNVQWDAMLEFIKTQGFDTDTDSTKWGNYYASKFEITRHTVKRRLVMRNGKSLTGEPYTYEQAYGKSGFSNEGWELTTGATERNKTKNIYDVAGNCAEWTMGISGTRY